MSFSRGAAWAVGMMFIAGSVEAKEQPEELGQVEWLRDFEQALAAGADKSRPVLVLFDEVPGCSTVKTYGKQVLSHPLIVEAAEAHFVPVAVYNNVGGADREVLGSFGEPTWNNPVVRIVDSDRKALSKRVAGDYTAPGLASAMVEALRASSKPVPTYLELMAAEHTRKKTEKATFGMYCFWSGEVAIGEQPGVISTKAGFLGGREVVEAVFDPQLISYANLLDAAKKQGQADFVFSRNDDQHAVASRIASGKTERTNTFMRYSAKDTRYQIRHTPLRFVPMTSAQATKVNSAIARRRDPRSLLSPRQVELFNLAMRHKDAGWQDALDTDDIRTAFARAEQVAAKLER